MKVNNVPMMTIDELRVAIPLICTELTGVIQSQPGVGKTSLLSMIANTRLRLNDTRQFCAY